MKRHDVPATFGASRGKCRNRQRLVGVGVVWLWGCIVITTVGTLRGQDKPADPAAESGTSDAASGTAEPAAESDELPLLQELPLPSAEDLLSENRRDWVVLAGDRVLVTAPVYPRPDTLETLKARRDKIYANARLRSSDEGKRQVEDTRHLAVSLFDDPAVEYSLKTQLITRIIHHEDLILQRVDKLIAAGALQNAFELLFVTARRSPGWPGLEAREIALTEAEVARLLDDDRGEKALAVLETLYDRKPVPRAAINLLGRAADRLIGEAAQANSPRLARYNLGRIKEIDSAHPAVTDWSQRLATNAETLRDEAVRQSAAGQAAAAATLIESAAQVWPALSGLRPLHARLVGRFPRLIVGVPRLATPQSAGLPDPAQTRVARLMWADLFEIDGFDASATYGSTYFERWEPTDLGRQARFVLRTSLPGWAARRALSAPETVALLAARLDPAAATFDPRFADVVAALQVDGPYTFGVTFRRIPLRTEAVLARPPQSTPGAASTPDVFGRFIEAERTPQQVVYRRALPETGDAARHVAELTERAFPNYEEAVRAFDRGEVGLLTDVPAWDVPRLRSDGRYVVKSLAVPATHLLQFHPKSVALQSAELRRALAASADAAALLTIVAGTGGEAFGRRVSAPWPSSHPGYDPLESPRAYDLPLAFALALAAGQANKAALPELVFAAPAGAPQWQAAQRLAATWTRLGLPIKLVTYEDAGETWDIAYRVVSLADPAVGLAPLLSVTPSAELTALARLPDWLRQRLIDLERAGDPTAAAAALIELHRLLAADVRIVPLFEIEQFLVSRGPIAGQPARPVAVYEGVEHWTPAVEYPEEVAGASSGGAAGARK